MRSDVIVPEVGEVGGEVTFVGWVAPEGAVVAVGDPLFEVDTAKAVLVVEAFAAGRLIRTDITPGTVVEPHQVVGIIEDLAESLGASQPPVAPSMASSNETASPRARRLAERLGVPLEGIRGTGPGGRIVEADIEAAAAPHTDTSTAPTGGPRALVVTTHGAVEALDITDQLEALVRTTDGLLWLSTPHTTAALIICEGDPEMLDDVAMLARGLLKSFEPFRHHRNDNPNGQAHLMSSLLGTQLIVPCVGGRLALGTWQRILLVELDGPKERTVRLTSLAAAEAAT